MPLDQVHLSNAQHNGEKMLRLKRSLHSRIAGLPSGTFRQSKDARWSCTGIMMQNV